MNAPFSRRRFLASSAAASVSLLGSGRARAASPNGKLRVLCVGVVGTIGEADRHNIASHPEVEIAGLCDVDSNYLAKAAGEHPKAFTCRDYREAFDKHADKFDAVSVSTPDHTHAPILLTAMAHGKHVYGQKPLVQQLSELVMIEHAIKAKPELASLLGNQRMANVARRLALEILKQDRLGKILSIHAWTTSGALGDGYFNTERVLKQNPDVPKNLDWDLWLGPCAPMPYHDAIVPMKWRSWWEFGSGGLGDWGCHLLDLPFLAYPELTSPFSVRSECPKPPDKNFHSPACKAVMQYKVDSPRFAGKTVTVSYYHPSLRPNPDELRLKDWPDSGTMTAIVGENGTLVVEPEGRSRLWRDGKWEEGSRLEGLPKLQGFNHWHSWVDKCLGKDVEPLTPFSKAVKITEATILGVRASRFPGQELLWDKAALRFTNHKEATETIVRRNYRQGFAPPRVG
ncbi:MAG: Gfo/Idh/MocA family oxidoreductase [Verrucomicrobia bacterium]|nr:Gfo/Idh/MocA family oxidoreductase [Verrucomicrobiota bacterium]